MVTLNQRLKKVSTYITGETLADIGSDHAYLPIYALENNLVKKAIEGEVIKGPFEASVKNVIEHKLSPYIDVRLGDGLSVLNPNEQINCVTICGMGGPLIAKIIKNGQPKLTSHPRLILQSNIQSSAIRSLLIHMNYVIVEEAILEEKGHIYEIIVADYSETKQKLSEPEIKFGPILLKNKTDLFFKKWEHECASLNKIKSHLDHHKHNNRLIEINNEINLINEVL